MRIRGGGGLWNSFFALYSKNLQTTRERERKKRQISETITKRFTFYSPNQDFSKFNLVFTPSTRKPQKNGIFSGPTAKARTPPIRAQCSSFFKKPFFAASLIANDVKWLKMSNKRDYLKENSSLKKICTINKEAFISNKQ